MPVIRMLLALDCCETMENAHPKIFRAKLLEAERAKRDLSAWTNGHS